MNKRIQKLLEKTKSVKSVAERQEIFDKINKLLDGKACGILLLSEIETSGRDKISTIAFNCDKEHSNLILAYLISKLPGIKRSLDRTLKQERNDEKRFIQMVR